MLCFHILFFFFISARIRLLSKLHK